MRDHDTSDDPRASYMPSMDVDSTADLVHEPFAEYHGPIPTDRRQWHALTRELVEAGVAQIEPHSGQDNSRVAMELLRAITKDTDRRFAVRATLYLRLLRIEGRSLAEIGKDFGLERASISHTYRQIKALHPGIHNPADKSEEYCEEAALRRQGKRKMREKPKWKPTFYIP